METGAESVEQKVEEYPEIPLESGEPGKKKFKMNFMTKVMLFTGAALVVGLSALLLTSPSSAPKPNIDPSARSKLSGADKPSNNSLEIIKNKENADIETKVREQAVSDDRLKDPKKGSYISADPFGLQPDGKSGTGAPPPEIKFDQAAGAPDKKELTPRESYAQQLLAKFTTPVYGTHVDGPGIPASMLQQSQNSDVTAAGQPNPATREALIPAGKTYIGLLSSGLSSLVPETPARAVIHGGPYSGAVMMGAIKSIGDAHVVVAFNQMSIGKITIPVNALATRAEDGSAALSDVVNSRQLEKAALSSAVGFIQSLGQSVLQEGVSQTQIASSSGISSSSTTPERSTGQKALIGIGGAASAVQPFVNDYIQKIKPEILVFPNKEIGIIFLNPVYGN